MHISKSQDKVIGFSHGDLVANQYGVTFRFRCGPAPRFWWMVPCRRHAGYVRKAWGNRRNVRYMATRRAADAHQDSGARIRKRSVIPLIDWDGRPSHNEKCWKRHRRTQYR